MSKIPLAKRLTEARRRLRDLAAAGLAMADARAHIAQDEEEEASRRLVASFTEAEALREGARCAALALLEEEQAGARGALQDAATAHLRARQAVANSREALLDRERALRRAERLLEMARQEANSHLQREEQRAADDRASFPREAQL